MKRNTSFLFAVVLLAACGRTGMGAKDASVSVNPGTATSVATASQTSSALPTATVTADTSSETPKDPNAVDASVVPAQRCLAVGTNKTDEGSKFLPITTAASQNGSAVAVWEVDAQMMRIYAYDITGQRILTASVRAPIMPTGAKMVGGVDDYVIAVPVTEANQQNGYVSDYELSYVSKIETTILAKPASLNSIALASNENGNFYSLEGSVGQGTSSTLCDDGNWDTHVGSTDLTIRPIRPLISVLQPNKTHSFGKGMLIVDAAVVGDKVSVMVSGGYSFCGKPAFTYAFIDTSKVFSDLNNGDTLEISGKPGDYGAPNTITQSDDIGSITGISMFASKSFTGMYWMGEKSSQQSNGSTTYNRSFHISMWNGMVLDPASTVDGLTGYIQDRPVVLGWNDNLVAISEGDGNTTVSLNVGKGDGKWDPSVVYTRDFHHYVKSFAGQGQHFAILDGTDMVSGTYGAWFTFVTCK